MAALSITGTQGLIEGYGRRISHVRLSVTARRDLRCRYCMTERMPLLPRSEVLSFEQSPEGHIFPIDAARPAVARNMSATGG